MAVLDMKTRLARPCCNGKLLRTTWPMIQTLLCRTQKKTVPSPTQDERYPEPPLSISGSESLVPVLRLVESGGLRHAFGTLE